MMRVLFLGSSGFAVPALRALVKSGHQVVCACTQPPKRAGRGKRLRETPIADAARELGLDVVCPDDPGSPDAVASLSGYSPDVGILAAYGHLLPSRVLQIPRFGFLNIHPSLLPRWRGAAPIERSIMAGDSKTGVCIMRMTEKLDMGPVLLRETVSISVHDTAGTLSERLAEIGENLLIKALASVEELEPLQPSAVTPTYAKKIRATESEIDWSLPSRSVDCLVRGLAPVPGAWSTLGNVRLKCLYSVEENGSGTPGEILDDDLLVACGKGAVRITVIQRPGGRPMKASEFQRGFNIGKGQKFVRSP